MKTKLNLRQLAVSNHNELLSHTELATIPPYTILAGDVTFIVTLSTIMAKPAFT